MDSNKDLREILSNANKGSTQDVIDQLTFIISRQTELLERMEREIAALRRHTAGLYEYLHIACPALADIRMKTNDPEEQIELVKEYYRGLLTKNPD